MQLTQTQLDALSILEKAQDILLLPSSPIDGDSLGSSLSLYLTLRKLGKKVTIVAEEAIPTNYNFLPEISSISRELNFIRDFVVTIECNDADQCKVRHEIQGNKINIIVSPHKGAIDKEHVTFSQGKPPYDCIVTVDTADPLQLGKIYENFTELFHLAPVINIDHHASNLGFGKINLVDVMAPSTTVMILPLIEELGTRTGKNLVDADISTLLLAGLITDTGSFQNPNTTPDAFAIAAKLIGYGARQQEIIRNIYKTKKLSTLRLWGRTLTKIQYDEKHKLVWSVLTAKDFAEIGSGPDETEGVIDELMSNAPGAEIIFLLKEKNPTEVGGSIRTLTPTIDASKLAGFFGGGGHLQAAGFKMQKGVVEAETQIVSKLREYQKERLRILDDVGPSSPVSDAVGTPAPAVPVTQSAPPSHVLPVTAPLESPRPIPELAPKPVSVPPPSIMPAHISPEAQGLPGQTSPKPTQKPEASMPAPAMPEPQVGPAAQQVPTTQLPPTPSPAVPTNPQPMPQPTPPPTVQAAQQTPIQNSTPVPPPLTSEQEHAQNQESNQTPPNTFPMPPGLV